MVERDDYDRTMEEHLALWNTRLEGMKARTPSRVDMHYDELLEECRAAGKAAFAELAALKAAAGDRWPVIKVALERAWFALESALVAEESRTDRHIAGAKRRLAVRTP